MVRQNLVVVTRPACRSGSVTHRRRWSPELAAGAAVSLDNKGTSRCRYINSLLNGQTINPLM